MADITNRVQAKTYADRAMTEMDKRSISPTPDNYGVWYTYASGQNPSLDKSIDKLTKGGIDFHPDIMEELHEKYFRDPDVNRSVLEMGDKLDGELNDVLKMLDDASKNTGEYGESLSDVHAALGSDRSQGEMRSLVETLVSATKKMEAHSRELESRLQESKSEVTHLRENLEEIRQEALTDQLTGLSNRRSFDEVLKQCVQHANESGEPLALALGDIDHFKKFNDTFGHQTGDQVLRLVAMCMREHVVDPLTPARYGGEEFALVMPGLTLEEATDVADRVRRTVESKELIKKSTGENLGTVTMSFGVSLYMPGERIGDLVARADGYLYDAKGAGRNCVISDEGNALAAKAS